MGTWHFNQETDAYTYKFGGYDLPENNDALLAAINELGETVEMLPTMSLDGPHTVGPAPTAEAPAPYNKKVKKMKPKKMGMGLANPTTEGEVKEKKVKTKTFKADKMANGFVFQSNPLAEGKEPFYMEAYLLGNNEVYISGGMAGTLNGEETKSLRKHLKMLINQLQQSYPEPDKEKGGKAVLKLDAPWVASQEQIDTLTEMVKKETKKQLEKANTEPDENTIELLNKIAFNTVVTAISQLKYEPFDEAEGGMPEYTEALENPATEIATAPVIQTGFAEVNSLPAPNTVTFEDAMAATKAWFANKNDEDIDTLPEDDYDDYNLAIEEDDYLISDNEPLFKTHPIKTNPVIIQAGVKEDGPTQVELASSTPSTSKNDALSALLGITNDTEKEVVETE